MNKKRIAAIIVLIIFLGQILALGYITIFVHVNKAEKIIAVLFSIFFLTILTYAFSVITKQLKIRRDKRAGK